MALSENVKKELANVLDDKSAAMFFGSFYRGV